MVSNTTSIGDGFVVKAGTIVQSEVKIGKGGSVSAGASVDYDAIVGDYCYFNVGSIVKA